MTLNRIAFVLLILGQALMWATILVGGAAYPGYDHARQYISELGATGAVTGWAVSWLGFLPRGLLLTAFALLAAWLLRRRPLAVAGLLLVAFYAHGLTNSAFYPCQFECARDVQSPAQMMHDLIGGAGYLAGVIGVLLVGLGAGGDRARWLMPLGVVCALATGVGFGLLAADGEFRGLAQRGLEASMSVFLLAFGHALRKGWVGDGVRPSAMS